MSTQHSGTGVAAGGRPKGEGSPAEQQESAVDVYSYLCGTALVLIGLVLFRKGLFPSAMFPVGAGLLGLFFRWRIAPALIIGITGSCLIYAEPGIRGVPGQMQRLSPGIIDLPTWILGSALLAYVIGHYRLQALSATLFPADRRLPKPAGSKSAPQNKPRSFHLEPPSPKPPPSKDPLERPRLGRTVGSGEISWLVFTIPFVTFAALLLLRLLPSAQTELGLISNAGGWLTLLLLWIVGMGVLLANGVLVYLNLYNLRVAEARVYLQDLLWLELRRDLRRLNRWLVWSRLRKDP